MRRGEPGEIAEAGEERLGGAGRRQRGPGCEPERQHRRVAIGVALAGVEEVDGERQPHAEERSPVAELDGGAAAAQRRGKLELDRRGRSTPAARQIVTGRRVGSAKRQTAGLPSRARRGGTAARDRAACDAPRARERSPPSRRRPTASAPVLRAQVSRAGGEQEVGVAGRHAEPETGGAVGEREHLADERAARAGGIGPRRDAGESRRASRGPIASAIR